jgi:hypothetical protein
VQDRVALGFWFETQPDVDMALRRLAAVVQAASSVLGETELLQLDHALARDGTIPAYLGGATGLGEQV